MTDEQQRQWHPVQANLMDAITRADTWHEVRRTVDAYFHAWMIFKGTFLKDPLNTAASTVFQRKSPIVGSNEPK